MWPDDRDLPIEVQAAFAANLTADPGTWSWTDLSSRLRNAPITTRVPGPGSPGTCSVTLDNDDGALSPLNPTSPYWPHVERGTPLRVRLRHIEDAFGRTASNGWGTSDSGHVWSVASGPAADQSVSGGTGRHSHPAANVLHRGVLATSLVDCEQVVDVSTSALLTGAALVTGMVFRHSAGQNYYWLRAEFNAGGTSVMLKISKCVAGGFTDLATLNPVPGLAYAANTPLRVRASVVGTRLAIKAWPAAGVEPAGWQLTATDGTHSAAGAVGIQSWVVLGNTNALPPVASFDSYAVRIDRFTGAADQWQPTYLPIRPGESSSAVRVTASGILRRLNQGVKPARSSPARFIPTTNPVAYWPLEDGQLVSEGAALVGGDPMRPFVGTHPSGAVVTFAQWGRGELAPWLPDAVSRTGNHGLSIIWAPVRMSAASEWCVDFMYRSGTDAGTSTVDINPSYLPGGGLGWPQLTLIPEFRTTDVSMNGEPEVGGITTSLFDGQPHHVRWYVYQDGTKVSWGVYVDGVGINGGTTAGVFTLPPVTSIALAAAAQGGADMAQGHLAVWAFNPNHPAAVAAALGHAGEAAADRVARLCAEEGIPVSVMPGASEPMGPQPFAGVMDLLREAEEADLGVLFELGYGLGYRPREARYNTAAALTVDLASYAVSGRGGDPLSPTYDDQDMRNEWTVRRVGGTLPVTAADIADQLRSGVYSDSTDLNVASDGVLEDHAWWRVHLGTVKWLREDTFPLDLAANPGLLDGWLSCQVGSRIARTNPPSQYGPEPLDRLVEGWTETIGPRSWLVQVTPSPASPWDVATVDGPQRVAADGSTLAADLTSGGMSLVLASTGENGPWTTAAADFPLDMRVGGERVTASSISSPLVDTFTRTVSGGWGTADTGQVWTVDGTAAQYSVATGLAVHRVNALNTAFRSRTTGLTLGDVDWLVGVRLDLAPTGLYIRAEPAIRIVNVNNYYALRVHVQPSGAVDLQLIRVSGGVESTLATAPSGVTNVAGTVLWLRLRADGSTLRGRVWRSGTVEPGWQVTATDSTHAAGDVGVTTLFPPGNTNALPYNVIYDNVTVTNPQKVTVSARAVNGVARAWPAGTEVDVWTPAVVSL